MMNLRTCLVVEDSKLLRTILETVLKVHCERLLTAESCTQALAILEENRDVELVLADLYLGDGTAFEILESLRERRGHKPLWLLMTTRWTNAAEERALSLGAVALLSKPIAMRDLNRAWSGVVEHRKATRRSYHTSVFVLHPDGTPLVTARLRNISDSGAFIETPLPVGEEVDLEIASGEAWIHVRALVVRLQKPSWLHPAGVGVVFQEPCAETRELLDELLASLETPRLAGSASDSGV